MKVSISQVIRNKYKALGTQQAVIIAILQTGGLDWQSWAHEATAVRAKRVQGQVPPFKESFICLPTEQTSTGHWRCGGKQDPTQCPAPWIRVAEVDVN